MRQNVDVSTPGIPSAERWCKGKLLVATPPLTDPNFDRTVIYVLEHTADGAVAVVLNRRFIKSRKATTSNWANRQLSESQIVYAANDAWAAMQVYHALGLTAPSQ